MIIEEFAQGLELIIVVEEKRVSDRNACQGAALQHQIVAAVIGKRDESETHLFPAFGTLEPHQIAVAVGERLARADQ